jgi:hypothetical protein
MARTGGYDQTLDVELGEGRCREGIVSDDRDICAEKTELLVQVPREGVEVIDEETVDRLCEGFWEGHCARYFWGVWAGSRDACDM